MVEIAVVGWYVLDAVEATRQLLKLPSMVRTVGQVDCSEKY